MRCSYGNASSLQKQKNNQTPPRSPKIYNGYNNHNSCKKGKKKKEEKAIGLSLMIPIDHHHHHGEVSAFTANTPT